MPCYAKTTIRFLRSLVFATALFAHCHLARALTLPPGARGFTAPPSTAAPAWNAPALNRAPSGTPDAFPRHPFLAQAGPEPPAASNAVQGIAVRIADALRRLGPWTPVVFILLFILATVCCIPGSFLTIASGALFGVGWGMLYVWIAAQIGSAAAFGISRHIARSWIMRWVNRRPTLAAIEEAVSQEGWKIVALTRLAPGSPFFLLNYFYGLTRVRFRDYFWATAITMIPGTLLFVYLGSVGQMALAGRIKTVWDWLLYGVGLVAMIAAVSLIARRANRALKARLGSPNGRKHPPASPTP